MTIQTQNENNYFLNTKNMKMMKNDFYYYVPCGLDTGGYGGWDPCWCGGWYGVRCGPTGSSKGLLALMLSPVAGVGPVPVCL